MTTLQAPTAPNQPSTPPPMVLMSDEEVAGYGRDPDAGCSSPKVAVDAHVLDKTPLPEGCYLSSSDAHPPTRVMSRAVVRLRNHNRDLVMPGDWIVRSTDGTLSVCEPEEFEAMYEADPEEQP